MSTPESNPDSSTRGILVKLLPYLYAGLTVLVRCFRYIPNLAPVGGLSLYAGARLPLWRACLVPIATMVVSDAILKQLFGYGAFNCFVYASFLIYVGLGRLLPREGLSWRMPAIALLGSVQFFLITNFGCWIAGHDYAKDMGGLLTCYAAGIPFFHYTLLGDFVYGAIFFGASALATASVRQRKTAEQPI